MPAVIRLLAAALLLMGAVSRALCAESEAAPQQVGAGISYSRIGHWDKAKLDSIIATDAPKFFGVPIDLPAARTGVTLYRVTYPSVIPERGNAPTRATGLLAIPDGGERSLPLLSYQHGTVYGKEQVPSFPDQSPETALALAAFAGQGYLVIGADYFGMGGSAEKQGYLVKASHQQATFDMLGASRAVLAQMAITPTKLFLGGWSQGGFVTMALLEKLEASGVPVTAAATASAPVDVFLGLNGFLFFPRKNDASWVSTLFVLTAFSFENYYGVPGLARSLIADASYDAARKVYEMRPFEASEIPADLHQLLKADYFDPQFFATSAYGRLLKEKTTAYRWVITTPVRNYYGEADEIITPGLGRLASTYQQAMGAGNTKVEAISTGETSHRGTYGVAVAQWKRWFDAK